MFKKKSRILSVLLSLALVFGTMCVPAFATDVSAGDNAVAASETAISIDINSEADLLNLQTTVSNLPAGSANSPSTVNYIVNLKKDLDMSNVSGWTGIGVPQSFKGFSGTFNGNNHKIKTSINNTSNVGPKGGLFNLTYNTNINDLKVEGNVSSNRFIGGIVGRAMGDLNIKNCTTSDLELTLNNGASNSVGGLIGQCGSGSGGGTGGGTGGTSGNTQGTVNVTGCNVGGTFISNTANNPVGGMFGHIYDGYEVNISSSTISADLSGVIVASFIGNNAGVVEITDCNIDASLESLDIAAVDTGTIIIN